jgi:23S rRNA G2445 N2-methylase RlmL
MTYRVIARVRSERDFHRTALRDELTATVASIRPRWRVADPAEIELWAVESQPDRFRLGIRLTTAEHRQRGGREQERQGALRPAVAAAMVRLAGPPPHRGARLVDPCCGAGTLLSEAAAAGWRAIGSDIDPDAVAAARRNTESPLALADAARLPTAASAADAVVANLPFGRQYRLPEQPVRWFTVLLDEFARITSDGAPLVVLVPESSGWRVALDRHGRAPRDRVDIRLLGVATTIWRL